MQLQEENTSLKRVINSENEAPFCFSVDFSATKIQC